MNVISQEEIAKMARKNKWVALPPKGMLPDGFYFVKIKREEFEDVITFKIDSNHRIINYFYATHYCPIQMPKH